MKQVGILNETPNNTFQFAGNINGRFVVMYVDKVRGGATKVRVLIPTTPEEEKVVITSIGQMSQLPRKGT